jgi:peroxiredoxin
MALTYTPNGEWGSKLPPFELKHVNGDFFSSSSLNKHQAIVVVFMCNHCPYVQAIENRLIQLNDKLQRLNVGFVGICSNDSNESPEDHPDNLLQRWLEKKYNFPYLVDTEQKVARDFGAVCTPDFFVYDSTMKLKYRGRLDDSWKDATKVQNEELWNAVNLIIKGITPNIQRPSMGCSIKWIKT